MLYFVKASDEGSDWIESEGHPPDLIYINIYICVYNFHLSA